MELWHWILEHLPKGSDFGEFISEWAPLIAGLCAIAFTLIEVIGVALKRRGNTAHGFFEVVHTFGVMLAILVVILVGFYTVATKWMRKPPEIAWKEQIEHRLPKCISKLKEPALQPVEQRLKTKYETAELHCLAYAMQRVLPEHKAATGSSLGANNFRREVKFADALLTVPGVSEILRRNFSISDEFLGYGYSLPYQSTRYSDATVHEYLIKNRCATWSLSRCPDPPQIDRQVYTWVFEPAELAKEPNKRIGALITGKPPISRDRDPRSNEAKDAFAPLLKSIIEHKRLNSAPPILIRFAKFQKSSHVGTIGRPDASHVFLSNLAELWDKGVNEADSASGRFVTPISGDENLTFFLWLYFPATASDAPLASWESVMYILEHELKVDADIARAMQ